MAAPTKEEEVVHLVCRRVDPVTIPVCAIGGVARTTGYPPRTLTKADNTSYTIHRFDPGVPMSADHFDYEVRCMAAFLADDESRPGKAYARRLYAQMDAALAALTALDPAAAAKLEEEFATILARRAEVEVTPQEGGEQ